MKASAASIEAFIQGCQSPAVWEDGDEPYLLKPDSYSIEVRSGRLTVEVWDDMRRLSRRVLELLESKPGLMTYSISRFGRPAGKLTFLDLDRPQAASKLHAGRRHTFAEKFRLILSRQLPGYELVQLSSSLDLQRSLSSIYPRAHIRRGNHSMAAVACLSADEESGLLIAALLWLDHIQVRIPANANLSLALFLPEGAGAHTATRLRWLQGLTNRVRLYRYNEHGSAGEVDAADLGNFQTRIKPGSDGPSFAARVNRGTSERLEHQFEVAVRRNLEIIDPTLQPAAAHDQVLSSLGLERSILDLLTVDTAGRLCVIELKVDEDMQLPLQALDYWIQIYSHARRGELNALFAAPVAASASPRLLLVAPANAFHPTNAKILRYFSPEIHVERIGVNSDWNRRLTVVMRLCGTDVPMSHETDDHGQSRFESYSQSTDLA